MENQTTYQMTRNTLLVGVLVSAAITYAAMGRLSSIHEILRIPLLDYKVIFLLYGLFWAGLGITRLFRRVQP